MTTYKSENALTFLKTMYADFFSLASEIKFNQKNHLNKTILSLYGSIVELTYSCIMLIDVNVITGVPIMQRAMLEAYVDLCNLIQDPKYGYSLELRYLKEWLKILKEAKAGSNRYLKAVTEFSQLDVCISQIQKDIKDLENEDYTDFSKKSKFEMAKMGEEYRSIYNRQCSSSHNDLRALKERHSEPEQDNLVFFKACTIDDYAHYIQLNATILIEATKLVHSFFDSPAQSKITVHQETFKKMCN